MRASVLSGVIAILAIAAISLASWELAKLSEGLRVARDRVGSVPVTVFRPAHDEPTPVVVIAHGFAGSQQLMQPFATTLARNGYLAVTFDFPGHGRHPQPLTGGLADGQAMQRDLLDTMAQVDRYARALAGSDGRLAVLGHSMAADVVVRHANDNPQVQATVAVSLFLPKPQTLHPRNLLIVDGALEARMLTDQAYEMVRAVGGADARAQTTYGSFIDGTARRLALSRGVEHIGVLYSQDSMREALNWMDQAFGRTGGDFLDRRGPWLGLLFVGLIALAWPLSGLLPRLAPPVSVSRTGWRTLSAVAVLPAILTPLLLWKAPTDFLPLLLGDYLVLHFGLYGALTAIGILLLGRRPATAEPQVAVPERASPSTGFALAITVSAVTAYGVLAIGLPLNTYVTAFMPGPWRWPLVAALLAGTLPYFLADEWLTRRLAPMRGAYSFTKFCFLLSLVVAVALNLEKLFFLVIIVPAILLLFGMYGLFSAWSQQRTGSPLVAAIANALVFAWFIAASFPVVSR